MKPSIAIQTPMKEIIRTPENRFENLEDYDFQSNYIDIDEGLRLHYVEEGTGNKPTVLLLHGEPSWSYLYRKMIPILSNNFRVIAPDLIGFGKSDKFVDKKEYSYQKHVDWMSTFIKKVNLNNIILFCQDWGGLIGLRIVTEMSDRFDMVVASNTTLPTGKTPMPDSFLKWRAYSQHSPGFNIGKVLDMGTVQSLSEGVYKAYNAPFPSEEYKAGARIFPTLVPIEEDDPESIKNLGAWEKLKSWNKPFLTIFGDEDNIMLGAEKAFQKLVPGAKGQQHKILHAGHFIQEEKGEELANLIIEFYKKNTTANNA
ncbi:haloalkane dehalogenase [Flavobacteriaceae bacterium GF1]